MFKSLLQWFRNENLLVQAKESVILMLDEDLKMFDDSVGLLWTNSGVTLEEIRERDQQINRRMRQVRKKVLTHLVFSGQSGLDTALVLISIVIDVERIGDHTKDITVLASEYRGRFNPGPFEQDVRRFEQSIRERLMTLRDIIDQEDEEKAKGIADTHKAISASYTAMLTRLVNENGAGLEAGMAVLLALYLRYLRRIEGHIFNVASAEVNPFHRIGFKSKKKNRSGEA
ncbi:PhoU domain-containing protein [bacterium]|nr:PhoU domain-containing protein [bacterium]